MWHTDCISDGQEVSMKTVQVTVKFEMEVEDPHDEDIMGERVRESLQDLIDDQAVEFKAKVIASDDDEADFEYAEED